MSEESVITDELRALIGKEFGPVTYEVEKGAIRSMAEAIGLNDPQGQDHHSSRYTHNENVVAPPTFLVTFRIEDCYEAVKNARCSLKRILNGGLTLHFYHPIKAGDTITTTEKVVDIQERQGKGGPMLLIHSERKYVNQRHELVAKIQSTGIRC